MKILVINGPNLNMLGAREENHYGILTIENIEKLVKSQNTDTEFVFYQSNIEGEIVGIIQNASSTFDGILINPGGYAHTSVAIRDALADCKVPKVEVHLSHLVNRESFRQNLITASGCDGYISGFKENGYLAGVFLLKLLLRKEGK